jgi:protein TonB
MDPIDDQEGGTDLSRETPKEEKPPEKTEDTISLDTKDERYVSYARIIKERLLSRWEYPQAARDNLIEGTCLVLFTLNRQGALQGIRIIEAASHPILDREAERAIQAASPYPPFPGSVTVQRLNIKANFAYRLTAKKH